MNKKLIVAVVIGILIIIGIISLFVNKSGLMVSTLSTVPVISTSTVPSLMPVSVSNTVPLMQSTGLLFSQYKYFSKAHEIFPILGSDTKNALGAFSYTKENIANNIFRFTITNNAEGYKGQSVIVSSDQFVYFIEPSMKDDSTSEDSITTDDILMAVDAQGNILK